MTGGGQDSLLLRCILAAGWTWTAQCVGAGPPSTVPDCLLPRRPGAVHGVAEGRSAIAYVYLGGFIVFSIGMVMVLILAPSPEPKARRRGRRIDSSTDSPD